MKEDEMPDFIKQFDPDTVDLNVDRQAKTVDNSREYLL